MEPKELILAQHLAQANGYEIFIRPRGTARSITSEAARQRVLALPGCRWVESKENRARRRWTDTDTTRLKALAALEYTPELIAAQMDRSASTIRLKCKAFGIPLRHQGKRNCWTAEDVEKLRRYTEKGMLDRDIANALGRSIPAIEHKRTKMNYKKPFPTTLSDPGTLAQVLKFKMLGWSHERIANVFGVSASRISSILLESGFYRFGDVRFLPHNRCSSRKTYQLWSELEVHLLHKALKQEQPFHEIVALFPSRPPLSVKQKAQQITRFWPSPAEREERKRFASDVAKKQLKVDWSAPRSPAGAISGKTQRGKNGNQTQKARAEHSQNHRL